MFFISLLMVFISSYFLTSLCVPIEEGGISNKNFKGIGLIYFLLIVFAQVVFSIELLSLFKAISQNAILVTNFIFLLVSFLLFKNGNKPIYKPNISCTVKKIWKALKKDKVLMTMMFGFLFLILVTVLLNLFMPVTSYDALTYHLNRASYWMHQGSLDHFITTDDRNLVMPINSEILYLWVLTFFKNDVGLNFVSFAGFWLVVFSLYNILGFLGFCERKKLWSVFIMSSFASVVAEISSVETDILLSGLVLSSIYLYMLAIKRRKLNLIFFSSLAYALAIGTKSPSVIAFPGVFLLMSYYSYRYLKKEFYKPLVTFLGLLFLNFVVFSSYNYILNYIQFGDFLGSEAARIIHGFRGGVKAVFANYVRYIFMIFDFSGFRYSEYVGDTLVNAKLSILKFFNIPELWGVEMPDNNEINNRLVEVKMGTGILGFLVFLPSVLTACVFGFCKKISNKYKQLSAFGLMFFINLLALSAGLAYMVFSVRFVTFLILISSPVLVLSYFKKVNLLKILILFYVMSYFLVMSVNLSSRPVKDIVRVVLEEKTIDSARERIRCALFVGYEGRNPFCYMRDMIKSSPKGTAFAVIPNYNSRMYILDMLNSHGYIVDTFLPELAETYDFSKYDYMIFTDKTSVSAVMPNNTKNTKIEYKINDKGDAYFEEEKPINCVYTAHDGMKKMIFNPKDKNQVVISSQCYFHKAFFKKINYSFVRSFDFQSVIKENANFMTIYKNNAK